MNWSSLSLTFSTSSMSVTMTSGRRSWTSGSSKARNSRLFQRNTAWEFTSTFFSSPTSFRTRLNAERRNAPSCASGRSSILPSARRRPDRLLSAYIMSPMLKTACMFLPLWAQYSPRACS